MLVVRRELRLILRLQVWAVRNIDASRDFVPEIVVMHLVQFYGKSDPVAVVQKSLGSSSP